MGAGGENLKAWREYRGLTQEQLARAVGASHKSVIQKLEKGRKKGLTEEWMRRLARPLRCEPEDLLRPPPDIGDPEPSVPSRSADATSVSIAELDLRAPSGTARSFVEVWKERVNELSVGSHSYPSSSFRTMMGTTPDGVVIVEVIGDSMTPTLLPGQRVVVDTKDKSPSPPGIFVVWDGIGLVLKRAEGLAHTDPARVKISSDNPKYEPYERVIDEAFIQGRVIAFWARLG